MKKLALVVVMLSACASTSEVPLDTAFALKHGETVTVTRTGLTLTFVDVADSRCPRDAVCVWEGEVTVHLRAKEQLFDIKVPGTATVDGYTIEVHEVTPHPHTATIIVFRMSEGFRKSATPSPGASRHPLPQAGEGRVVALGAAARADRGGDPDGHGDEGHP